MVGPALAPVPQDHPVILTGTQNILLTRAGRRDSGSVFPLPETIAAGPGAIAKLLKTIMTLGLAEKRETNMTDEFSRNVGTTWHAAYITATGRSAIG